MQIVPGAEVQALIARHMLGAHRMEDTLGSVTLRPHQVAGAIRARHLLDVYGGVLIADDVGLGKTFLALAVARDARDVLVVAPAALRATWAAASERTAVALRFVSLESLAQGRDDRGADLILIDEAHHLRNPTTRGFAACRALCTRAKVLLLSATPVQNCVADLRVVLSLFLGERAHALSLDELVSFVVKRDAGDVTQLASMSLPAVESPQWLQPEPDVDCLDRILALPPPLPPADGEDGGALLTYTLVRQWASSRAALRGALKRRIARAHALEDALVDGRMPTRAELAAWALSDSTQQIAFPLMATGSPGNDSHSMLQRVREHRQAVRDLVTWLDSAKNPDVSRAGHLRQLMATHPGRRVIAFSEHSDTVTALFRALVSTTRVAMLTHAGGRVAGGRVSRREMLAAFAPESQRHERDRIDLLLATDVLSEGVDLQGASAVVHLDMPWNPARLAQRVGRVRRLGSPEATVLVFAMAPPTPAARMLEIEARLRQKVGDAARAVGVSGAILPGLSPGADPSSTKRSERFAKLIAPWRSAAVPMVDGPVCGAVRAGRAGALACVRIDGAVKLVAIDSEGVSAKSLVDDLLETATTESVPWKKEELDRVIERLNPWMRERGTSGVVDLPARRLAIARREVLRRTDRIAHAAPRHSRAVFAPLVFAARKAAVAPMSAGAERVLEELTSSSMSDEAWLRALGEFAALHATPPKSDEILAILLLAV